MSGRPPKSGDFPDVTNKRELTEAPTLNASVPGATGVADPTGSLETTQAPSGSQLAEASRYDNEGRVGTGGMGSVDAVYDRVLLRRVAMKSLHTKLSGEEEHIQRFLEEVQITGQLDHPNIVPVHDVGFHDNGSAFFIMKLVKGETLSKLLAAEKDQQLAASKLEEFLEIFVKICDAIDFAHSRRVIHRDLKPSNIMVGKHGEVYVMDWGIALLYDSHKSSHTAFMPEIFRSGASHRESAASLMGTAAYMAPEQAKAEIDAIDFRTDVFGLGGILYEIITGEPPYSSENPGIQLSLARLGEVRPPAEVAGHRRLPPGLCRIAMKALAVERDDRYQSARELKEAVQAFLRGGGWFDICEFEPGTVIVAEGDPGDAAYIIEEGTCEVYKGQGADRQFLRKLGPGDAFGETAIFTGSPRTATVVAVDRVRAATITAESLDYELAEKSWFGMFVRALAERFRDYDARLAELRSKK